jgi:histidyl-tRNA synthetase
MVISVVLEELGLLPENRDSSPAKVIITVFDEESQMASYQLGAELRQAGLNIYSYPTPDKLGKQFRHADRIGACVAVILGPEEIANNQVALKDLKSREQKTVNRSEAAAVILKLLDNDNSA